MDSGVKSKASVLLELWTKSWSKETSNSSRVQYGRAKFAIQITAIRSPNRFSKSSMPLRHAGVLYASYHIGIGWIVKKGTLTRLPSSTYLAGPSGMFGFSEPCWLLLSFLRLNLRAFIRFTEPRLFVGNVYSQSDKN